MLRTDLKIAPQRTSWKSIVDTCTVADAEPAFRGVWLHDHLSPVESGGFGDGAIDGCFEGWTALAAVTSRLRLGLLVSAVQYRNVALLANMVSTVDHISGGRVELGLGAGNNPAESNAFGLPFGTPGERTTRLGESASVLQRLLAGECVTHESTHFSLGQARCSPVPMQRTVPMLVGGKGERKTLRTAAAVGGWNYSVGTSEEFGAERGVLQEHARRLGIDPASLRCSVQVRVRPETIHDWVVLASRYVAAGATDIVAYINPLPGFLDAAFDMVEQLHDRHHND